MTQLQTVSTTQDITRERIELWKRTYCKGATDDELAVFVEACRRTGLAPEARQIYMVRRDGVMKPETSIDGYRLAAQRTGEYAGTDDAVFDDEETPKRATVAVYRIVKGVRCPTTATARWKEYYPGDKQGFMWRKMPCTMLGKCAEALALRKAFPQELSGLYTKEEMEQAGTQVIDAEVTDPLDDVYQGPDRTPDLRRQIVNWMTGLPPLRAGALAPQFKGKTMRQIKELIEDEREGMAFEHQEEAARIMAADMENQHDA